MKADFGPDQRRMFETTASRLFADVAARGGVEAGDPILQEDPDAADLLKELGLLRLDPATHRYVAVDPQSVQGSVIAPMGQEGANLIAESSRWAQAFSTLGQAYRRSPYTEGGPITELRGFDAINGFLADVVAGAKTELLTARPQADRRMAALRAYAQRDIDALQRGLSMRTIYQHSARRGSATRQYVARVTAEGAEVRTLDEFFNRLIVIDREVAIIPGNEDNTAALVIRDQGLVTYLVDIFERFWDRGRPFTGADSSRTEGIVAEQRAMTIRMLIEGHSDASCAKRLGVSPRTYAAYVAELKDEYDAQTRFQLGYRMGLRAARSSRAKKS